MSIYPQAKWTTGMKTRHKGTILVATLWIITILSIMAIGIGFRISMEARLSKYNMERLKASGLANAGVALCQDLLSKDTNDFDSIGQCGLTLSSEQLAKGGPEGIFKDAGLGEEGTFTISYRNEDGGQAFGMVDEERKINVNTNDPLLQDALKSLFSGNAEIAAAIIDWRDVNTEPSQGGAEDEYYGSLEYPYKCKNGDFAVIEELLLVRGMTRDMYDSVKGYVTVWGDSGKININTASKRVLEALGITPEGAGRIIDYRNASDGLPGTSDDNIFTDVNIVGLVPGLPEADNTTLGNLGNCFTTKSDYFKIESHGLAAASKTAKTVEAVMKRDPKRGGELIYYREY